jgi:hypothetical protein
LNASKPSTPDNQNDCPQYKDVQPGTPAEDGQVNASSGCVYPASVKTLFNQLDAAHISWKTYAQDMGNTASRENVYQCGIPVTRLATVSPIPLRGAGWSGQANGRSGHKANGRSYWRPTTPEPSPRTCWPPR